MGIKIVNKPLFVIFLSFVTITSITLTYFSYSIYQKIFQSNVSLDSNERFFYIKSGSDFDSFMQQLEKSSFINDIESFRWLAEKKNLPSHIYGGKYKIKNGWTNNQLIDHLRSKSVETANVTFNNVRTFQQLAGKVSKQIEADSASLLSYFKSEEISIKYGFKGDLIKTMFLPNTYQFYWNTSPEKFVQRMAKEYKKFWNDENLLKAKRLGLSQSEVSILASIVEKESAKMDELAIIAGVYFNRLKKGMKLQADPTLIYAIGDFSIKRVLNEHKKIASPYNTYKFKGLPPGPICFPSLESINAVLNLENHSFLYFCAKEDMSGYHNFSKSYSQHLKNARKFQKELNRRRIFK